MAIWGFVRIMANQAVTAAIEADLTRAERLVHRVQRDRLATLALTARLVPSFPELKALFATDAATVRDDLVSYQQHNPEVPPAAFAAVKASTFARSSRTSARSAASSRATSVIGSCARAGCATAVNDAITSDAARVWPWRVNLVIFWRSPARSRRQTPR
jgi:hypothetical protein